MFELVRKLLYRIRLNREQRPFEGLSLPEVFDEIYLRKAWGKSSDGTPFSGSGSHFDVLTDPYVEQVNDFLATLDNPSVADLGCGDFSIGSRMNCRTYVGCDISEVVLASNRERFPDVDFRRLDVIEDQLPKADVGVVRQVLQHLDNASINRFLAKPLPYKYLIVSEGLPAGAFTPNLDKPIGPAIRLPLNSGIDLKMPPFNARFAVKQSFDVPGVIGRLPNRIRTTIYQL